MNEEAMSKTKVGKMSMIRKQMPNPISPRDVNRAGRSLQKAIPVEIRDVTIVEGHTLKPYWKAPMYVIETNVGKYIATTIKHQQASFQNGFFIYWEGLVGSSVRVTAKSHEDHMWIMADYPTQKQYPSEQLAVSPFEEFIPSAVDSKLFPRSVQDQHVGGICE